MDTSKITRVEVIGDKGREYVNNEIQAGNVWLSLQDDERTLKIFIANYQE